jgi:hypothetical protein
VFFLDFAIDGIILGISYWIVHVHRNVNVFVPIEVTFLLITCGISIIYFILTCPWPSRFSVTINKFRLSKPVLCLGFLYATVVNVGLFVLQVASVVGLLLQNDFGFGARNRLFLRLMKMQMVKGVGDIRGVTRAKVWVHVMVWSVIFRAVLGFIVILAGVLLRWITLRCSKGELYDNDSADSFWMRKRWWR